MKELEKHKVFTTIKKLIFKGANPSIKDAMGRKPVEFAETFSDQKLIEKTKRILNSPNQSCRNFF